MCTAGIVLYICTYDEIAYIEMSCSNAQAMSLQLTHRVYNHALVDVHTNSTRTHAYVHVHTILHVSTDRYSSDGHGKSSWMFMDAANTLFAVSSYMIISHLHANSVLLD